MSAGEFTDALYQADSGEIHPIRVQPETLLFTSGGTANAAPAGPATSDISAKVGKTAREIGLGPRHLTFKFDAGQAPTGYEDRGTIRIPVLTTAAFTAYVRGNAATYLTGTGVIVNKTTESAK